MYESIITMGGQLAYPAQSVKIGDQSAQAPLDCPSRQTIRRALGKQRFIKLTFSKRWVLYNLPLPIEPGKHEAVTQPYGAQRGESALWRTARTGRKDKTSTLLSRHGNRPAYLYCHFRNQG